MPKGRKPLEGTHEAREFLNGKDGKYLIWMDECPLSVSGRLRLEKALKFGLGIKEDIQDNKVENEPLEKKNVENNPVVKKLKKQIVKKIVTDSEDEYFDEKDCKEVEY